MSEAVWYVAAGGRQYGPFTLEALRDRIRKGQAKGETLVYGPGATAWRPLRDVPELAGEVGGGALPPPPPSLGTAADEIDFRIVGDDMQYVEITLDPGEAAIAEAGGMMYMTSGIEMTTVFGDGRAEQKSFGDLLLGAGKRLLTGESLFVTVFTNTAGTRQRVAFAAPYSGKIVPIELSVIGGTLICQKDSFLCAARGVGLELHFQKKFGVGLFGGEGFVMQKLVGDGLAFVHAGGTVTPIDLAPGERLRIDTGCIVALEPSVSFDIQLVGGVKTALFGGEGLFLATLTGPGRCWLQSLPFSRLASRIYRAAPRVGGGRKEEGTILDVVGGIGKILT